MKINVKDLKVGDVFMIPDDKKVFKVVEISEIPVYTLEFEEVYPIMCDCFSPEHGKTFGYTKLPDEVEEVELLYRENEERYESWTSVVFKGDEEDES